MVRAPIVYLSATDLARFVTAKTSERLDFWVWNGTKDHCYTGLKIVHRCSYVEWPRKGKTPTKVHIVAGGFGRPGPFVFVWMRTRLDPDRAACTGMPLTAIATSAPLQEDAFI